MASDPEPQWLDSEEADSWRQLAQLLAWLPASLDAQLRTGDLTHFEYAILAVLSEAPGRTLAMTTLAGMANGSLSRLSHVVKRLEERGWVRRRRCPGNGRVTNAVLTDDGFAAVLASAPAHVTHVRRIVVDQLSRTQLRQLGAIARRLNAAHETESGRPGEAEALRRSVTG